MRVRLQRGLLRCDVLLQRAARRSAKRLQSLRLLLQRFQRGFGAAAALPGADADARIACAVGQLFQQFGAFAVGRLQEGGELGLRQQHGAGELIEGQAERPLDLGTVLADLLGDQLSLAEIAEGHLHRLQTAVGPPACAADAPARAVLQAVLPDEIDLRPGFAGTAPHQRARIGGGDLLAFDIGRLRVAARHGAQPRGVVVERQTERVEDRGLAGAGRSGDCKQPGARQRTAIEQDLVRAGQRGDVAQADRQNLHRAASSASSTSVAKSASTLASGSLP